MKNNSVVKKDPSSQHVAARSHDQVGRQVEEEEHYASAKAQVSIPKLLSFLYLFVVLILCGLEEPVARKCRDGSSQSTGHAQGTDICCPICFHLVLYSRYRRDLD